MVETILNCKTRTRIALKIVSADMGQLPFRVEPDLAAEVSPLLAKTKVLADIGPVSLSIMQSKSA